MNHSIRFVILGASILLGACAALRGNHASFAVYAPQLQIAAAEKPATQAAIDWQLLIDTPLTSTALNTRRIAIMSSPGVLEVYADARWRDPAPLMLRSLLVQAFDQEGRVGGVSAIDSGLNGDYSLAMDLRDFQIEIVDGAPRAAIRCTARLFDRRSNRIVASQSFSAETPAAGKDVASAVDAFTAALDQLLPKVVSWTIEQGQANRMTRPANGNPDEESPRQGTINDQRGSTG